MRGATASVSSWDPGAIIPELDPTVEEGTGGRFIAEPERRLLFAVLSDAIVRIRRLADSRRPSTRHDLMESERWIRSEDREWPCSFINVCEALGIEPEPLRRAVLRWRTAASPRERVTRRGLLVRAKTPTTDAS